MDTAAWILIAAIVTIAIWALIDRDKAPSPVKNNESPEKALKEIETKRSLLGKVMQFSYNTFPSYWEVVEEDMATGELRLKCTDSPFSFKNGNASKGDEIVIARENFREYRP